MKNAKADQDKKTRAFNQEPACAEVYYDSRGGNYWYRIKNRFLNLSASDIKMHLRTEGFRDDQYYHGLDELTWQLYSAQTNRVVDYAGPLAGHRVGLARTNSGKAILVTQEPAGVYDDLPEKFDRPEWFIAFLEELLPDEQWIWFSHWLRIALESLRAGDFRQGQVPILAGESGCGKSLLQNIVTEVLGGRSANPWAYMMGSQFNYSLAGAEHWQIEDPATTTDLRTRRFFGNRLKECNYNRDISINQKGKDELLLQIFRRTTISVNLEIENLAVVPPLDDSLRDKISLFRCDVVRKAMAEWLDTKGLVNRGALWEWVKKNAVAIRAWLLTGLPPLHKDHQRGREGIVSWHHPELFMSICDLSPELRLLHVIDEVMFKTEEVPFIGKAIELEKQIRGTEFGFEVEKLLKSQGSAGAYLGRLAKSFPERIAKLSPINGVQRWKITAPKS